jgi:hypothetical protein
MKIGCSWWKVDPTQVTTKLLEKETSQGRVDYKPNNPAQIILDQHSGLDLNNPNSHV